MLVEFFLFRDLRFFQQFLPKWRLNYDKIDFPQIRDSQSKEAKAFPVLWEVKHCNQKEGGKGLGSLGLLGDSGHIPMNASPQMLCSDLKWTQSQVWQNLIWNTTIRLISQINAWCCSSESRKTHTDEVSYWFHLAHMGWYFSNVSGELAE